jgi:GAF domain-containing protein
MNLTKNATAAKPATSSDSMNDLRLATARKRLLESAGTEDAIEGLREIVGNLLGCEEIGLFKVNPNGKSFSVCWSFGADLKNYDLFQALGHSGQLHILRGECHVELKDRDRSTGMAKAQAFIPIRASNQTVAVLAILRLLPQKVAFDAQDFELFKLLSQEAAVPLFGANAHLKPFVEDPGIKP